MKQIFHHHFPPPPGRVKVAGVLCAGALALLALDVGLELQPTSAPSPAVARIATPLETSSLHSLSYYPEQLAALKSLASFTPQADSGVADPSPAANAVKPQAAGDVKPIRRAEAARPAALARGPSTATAVGPSPPQDRSVKLFGIAVPGTAELSDRVSSLRENASRWGEAAWGASGRAATFWR